MVHFHLAVDISQDILCSKQLIRIHQSPQEVLFNVILSARIRILSFQDKQIGKANISKKRTSQMSHLGCECLLDSSLKLTVAAVVLNSIILQSRHRWSALWCGHPHRRTEAPLLESLLQIVLLGGVWPKMAVRASFQALTVFLLLHLSFSSCISSSRQHYCYSRSIRLSLSTSFPLSSPISLSPSARSHGNVSLC